MALPIEAIIPTKSIICLSFYWETSLGKWNDKFCERLQSSNQSAQAR